MITDSIGQLYTMDPRSFKDSEDTSSRGRRWADEAEIHLAKIHKPSLPLLQGLFAMFCYEGVVGNGTKSVEYYLRAMDTYKILNEADILPQEGVDEARLLHERQATSWCMWGFYCCEWYASK